MAEQTVNVPQILVFVVIIFLSLRWYYSKPSNATTRAPIPNRGFRVNPAQVDQIAQMFPQLDRRAIMWDLQRNGGNISATTERVLSGRALETPPPSFQPPLPRTAPPSRTTTPVIKPSHPDLITRYNLSSKLNSTTSASSSAESEIPKKLWSADKTERQRNLQRRREEMILAARRKLEEKERAKSTGAAS